MFKRRQVFQDRETEIERHEKQRIETRKRLQKTKDKLEKLIAEINARDKNGYC